MAVPYRRTDRQNRYAGKGCLQHHHLLHAVYQRILPAAQGSRPSEGRTGRLRQLCVHRSVCRNAARHHLHNGILHAYRYESVYTLLDIDRAVPEVWGSKYDVRELLRACYYAIDKKPISEVKDLSLIEREMIKVALKKVKGTDIELLLRESGLIE